MEDSNTETITTSIELDFRLDFHGRTTLPQTTATASCTDTTTTTTMTKMTKTALMDYATRCTDTSLILQEENGKQDHLYFPTSACNGNKEDDKTNNNNRKSSSWYDDVLLDCEMADSGLMPRTFWVSAADGAAPRCTLEQWALDIFHHHVNKNAAAPRNKKKKKQNDQHSHDDDDDDEHSHYYCEYEYDPMTSGAEWWVQIRPQLNAQGRYEMHADPADYDKHGICFHWDKDEDLRLACGGNLYIHPHLSTVTYLTSHGAPTMVVEHARIHNILGTWIVPPTPPTSAKEQEMEETNEQEQGEQQHEECHYYKSFISWPLAGKHLCFDGRYLHAAPSNLLPVPQNSTTTTEDHDGNMNKKAVSCSSHSDNLKKKKQETMPSTAPTSHVSTTSNHPTTSSNSSGIMTREEKRLARRGRRITFLVNIWLNYKPLNVEPFPEAMLDKMSGSCSFASSCSPKSVATSAQAQATTTSSTSSSSTYHPSPAPTRPFLRFGKLGDNDSKNSKEEEAGAFETTCVTIANCKVVEVVPPQKEKTTRLVETFTWPMGSDDSGESIQMQIPLNLVQEHQAQLDATTTTSTTTNHHLRRGGNIHIYYVPGTGSSCSTASDPTRVNNLGVVLLKSDDANNNNNNIDNDDDSPQPRAKRTAPLNDDNGNDNSCCAKRPNSNNNDFRDG